MTRYMVFTAQEGGWTLVGETDAATPGQAIRNLAGSVLKDGVTSAYFAACPARSWKTEKLQATIAYVAEKS